MTERIALGRFARFGDVMLTLPVIEALAADGVRVDLVTSGRFSGLFAGDPRLDRVLCPDSTGGLDVAAWGHYDAVIDLHSSPLPPELQCVLEGIDTTHRIGCGHSPRPAFTLVEPRRYGEHIVSYYARVVSTVHSVEPAPARLAPAAIDEPASYALFPGDVDVCVVPGSRDASRRWPAGRYAELVRGLEADGVATVLVGHTYDADVVEAVASECQSAAVVLTGNDGAIAGVFRRARVVVANNSAHLHVAALAGTPVVCVEGHVVPGMWSPLGDGHETLRGAVVGCACDPAVTAAAPECASAIPVDDVAAAVSRALRRAGWER